MGEGGVHIAPEVRKFLEVTLGFSWPESDDRGLTALWLAWAEFEKAATAYQAATEVAGIATAEALVGETGEFFGHYLGSTVPAGLDALAGSAGELAKMAKNAAADVYKTKVMFVVFAAFALATVIELLVSVIGALFVAPVLAAARISIGAIWRALITKLGALTRPVLLRGLAETGKQTAKFAAIGAGLMAGTDFGVQAQQVADGLRDGWDTRSLTSSLVGGLLGGGFAGLFHAGAGLIRSTAFSLEGRLVKIAAGKIVTAPEGVLLTELAGPLKAIGHLAYGTGQVGIALLTAPLVNVLTGNAGANPFLGIVSAFSAHGGRRAATTGSPALDAIHPPVLPTFTVPEVKTGPTTEKNPIADAGVPPTYTAVVASREPLPALETASVHTAAPTVIGGDPPLTKAMIPASPWQAADARERGPSAAAVLTQPVRLSVPTTTAAAGSRAAEQEAAISPARNDRGPVLSSVITAPTALSANTGPRVHIVPDGDGSPVLTPGLPAERGLSSAATSFLTEPPGTTVSIAPHPDAVQGSPALFPDLTPRELLQGLPTHSPVQPVRAIPLPGGGGVAFITGPQTRNVLNAFPSPEPGVFRLVTHQDGGHLVFPGDDHRPLPHRPGQVAEVLNHLDPRLGSWRAFKTVELWTCDLTPEHATTLGRAVRTVLGADLTVAHPGRPVYLTPQGAVHTTDPGVEGTLTLGPKRNATDLGSASRGAPRRRQAAAPHAADDLTELVDPETATRLTSAAIGLFHRYGDLNRAHLLSYLREHGAALRIPTVAAKVIGPARETVAKNDELWTPLYRGELQQGAFDLRKPDEFTVWSWQQAITRPVDTAEQIARTAYATGFSGPADVLVAGARKAIEAAKADDRRHPELVLKAIDHRPMIEALADRFVADHGSSQASIIERLRARNVRGEDAELQRLVNERQEAWRGRTAAGARPALPSGKTFLGRSLDADRLTDHELIDKIAYAAAWADKSATPADLTRNLIEGGVTGAWANLFRLVETATAEAARNGDRLLPLDSENPAHHDAIRSRIGTILRVTPELRDPARVKRLGRHARMRHISGSQAALEEHVRAALETPADHLPTGPETAGPEFDPIVIRAGELDPGNEEHHRALDELARKVVEENGSLLSATLCFHMYREGAARKGGIAERVAAALAQAADEGSLWQPVYRGRAQDLRFQTTYPNDFTAVLWQLAISHPNEKATEIARRAEHAGLIASRDLLVASAKRAIEAAELHQRRRPVLNIADRQHDPRVDELLDAVVPALLRQKPDDHVDRLLTAVRTYNLEGTNSKLRAELAKRKAAFAQANTLGTGHHRAQTGAEGEPPSLVSDGLFLGRSLDADNPADHGWIDKLAYAAAWSDKSATPQHLTRRLMDEGIKGAYDTLAALVGKVVAEAVKNGDRLERLSADSAFDRHNIQRRIGELLLRDASLRDPGNPDRVTQLVKQMRVRQIAGSQRGLRAHAESMLEIQPHRPLPDSSGIPARSPVRPVRAIPLPDQIGFAFVQERYAANIAAAFPTPEPGVLRIVVDHDNGVFSLPGFLGGEVIHTPDQLIEVISTLPLPLATWNTIGEIRLWACRITEADGYARLVQALQDHPSFAAGGLRLSVAHPGLPIHITPDGHVQHVPSSAPGTLTLGPGHPEAGPSTLTPAQPHVSRLFTRLSDRLEQAQRHITALPPTFEPALRAEIDQRQAALSRVTVRDLTARDAAGLPAKLESVDRLVAALRDARLNRMVALHDAAIARIGRGESPLRFYPDGVPDGVTSSPDARFGLEIEFQLLSKDFDGDIKSLGEQLEAEGLLEWNDGKDFHDTETQPGRWTLVTEDVHEGGGELRSPILPGGPGSWTDVAKMLHSLRTYRDSEGEPLTAERTGGHVNLSFDYQLSLPANGRLARLAKAFEDVLYRLGNHHGPASPPRRLTMVGPTPLPPTEVTSLLDVRGLNFDRSDAINFTHVRWRLSDRYEFRFWAGALTEAEWQVHAELSGVMLLAAENPSIDGVLGDRLTRPRLVGHTPGFSSPRDELAYLMDFLELLPLSPAAEEQAVALHSWTRPVTVTRANDPRYRAQTVIGPGGRGWYFPMRGSSIEDAVATASRLPRYPHAEVVAASLTSAEDAIDAWTTGPMSYGDFLHALSSRGVTLRAQSARLDEPRIVLAVRNGAARLGPTVSLSMREPVVVTEGQVRITPDGRLETDTEWIELESGSVRLRTGQKDLGAALEAMEDMDSEDDY